MLCLRQSCHSCLPASPLRSTAACSAQQQSPSSSHSSSQACAGVQRKQGRTARGQMLRAKTWTVLRGLLGACESLRGQEVAWTASAAAQPL